MPATRPPSCRIVSGPSGISPFRLSRTSSVMTVKIRRVAGSQRLSMAVTSAITIAVAVLTRSASATGTTVVASAAGAHASATTAARIHEPRRLHTMAAHIRGQGPFQGANGVRAAIQRSSVQATSGKSLTRDQPPAADYYSRSGSATRLSRSEEHTSELQSHSDLVCRLLLEKKNKK